MTIMVKTNVGTQKQPADVIVTPLIEVEEPEWPANKPRKLPPRPASAPPPSRRIMKTMNKVMTLALLALFITLVGFTGGIIVLSNILYKSAKDVAEGRIRLSCAISTSQNMDYVVVQEAPTTASWFGIPTTEMKVYSSASDLISAKILNNLIEDMLIEEDIENIYVHDGPRSFKVVHDFNENYTNIISPARCFLMDMIRQFVLEPASLIASFRNESAVELSHAHSVFTAALPTDGFSSSGGYPAVARPCLDDNKPVYHLNLEGTHVLHKRSVDLRMMSSTAIDVGMPRDTAELANNEFVQFSGRHLQRITISNLDDVLKYEDDNNRLHPHPKLAAGRLVDE